MGVITDRVDTIEQDTIPAIQNDISDLQTNVSNVQSQVSNIGSSVVTLANAQTITGNKTFSTGTTTVVDNINVQGNLTVNGTTTTLNTTSINISDNTAIVNSGPSASAKHGGCLCRIYQNPSDTGTTGIDQNVVQGVPELIILNLTNTTNTTSTITFPVANYLQNIIKFVGGWIVNNGFVRKIASATGIQGTSNQVITLDTVLPTVASWDKTKDAKFYIGSFGGIIYNPAYNWNCSIKVPVENVSELDTTDPDRYAHFRCNGVYCTNVVGTGVGQFSGNISGANYSGTHSGTSSGTNTGDLTIGNVSSDVSTQGAILTGQQLQLIAASDTKPGNNNNLYTTFFWSKDI